MEIQTGSGDPGSIRFRNQNWRLVDLDHRNPSLLNKWEGWDGFFQTWHGGAGVGVWFGSAFAAWKKCDKLRRHLTLDVSMSHGNLEFTRLIQPFFNIFFPDFWELTFGNSKSPDSVFASFSTCFSAYAFPFRFLAYMAQGFLAKLPPHTWHRPGLEISSNTSPIPTVIQNS